MLNDIKGDALMFQCPVCERWLLVMKSKRDKPYVVCDDCGVQMFIRFNEGIKRFFQKCVKKSNIKEGVI